MSRQRYWRLPLTQKNMLITGARASGREEHEVWSRRQSMQASGGTAQNEDARAAGGSVNGTVGVDRETGQIHDGCGFLLLL